MTADEPAPGSSNPAPEETPRVEVRNLTKRYGSVIALRGVNMELRAGEIVGLVGDNGAGKSTLVNIIAGALPPTSGTVLVDGSEVTFRTPIDARKAGIETVYQDLALAPDLSIWANMFLGREKVVSGPLGRLGWLDRKAMMARRRPSDLERTKITDPVGGRPGRTAVRRAAPGGRGGPGGGLGLARRADGRADRGARRRAAGQGRRADPDRGRPGPGRCC